MRRRWWMKLHRRILEEPNWGLNLKICNLLNSDEFNGSEVVRAIKKKIAGKNVKSQRLSLELLETCAMNCDKVFSEVASEKLLDEMVLMFDNPQTHQENRRIAFQLIEAWGKSVDLAYLPVFRQTYLSLKARQMPDALHDDGNSPFTHGTDERRVLAIPQRYPYSNIDEHDFDSNEAFYESEGLPVEEKKEILVVTRNSIDILASILNSVPQQKPIKDELMMTILEKCKDAQPMLQRIIETTVDDEPLLIEALSLHDELQQVLAKCEERDFASPQTVEHNPDDSGTPCSQPGGCTSEEKDAADSQPEGNSAGERMGEAGSTTTNVEKKA
ncbi:ENTH/VHS domain-containing protein [Dioscorea alata]|uniref:ENTH/VHS domain-containing protein n=2 Tax=Dioscorea alata TaxID=55571 RepID=A0ACB7V8D0_DIOAL|nr:ENTH/VHS domain-containing protein [Dioscorea alata]KAH7669824.1 ENTH/VHS domain-containing protein [Dioscorea alata]